ncbi:MAG: TatD family hydrolase [Thermoguttaceae bacterium]
MIFGWNSKRSTNSEPCGVFDTHGHLTLPPFTQTDVLDAVMLRSRRGEFPPGSEAIASTVFKGEKSIQLAGIVVPGTSVATSRASVSLAEIVPLIHAAVGIHPNDCNNVTDGDWREIESLSAEKPVVAIGETGLDLHWRDVPIERQREMFERHLDLAERRRLPILIHCREAWRELITIIKQRRQIHGVVHAFSGDTEDARTCLEAGLYISFAGSLTYRAKKSVPVWEAARYVPDDRLLVETDAPYLVPHDLRDAIKTNEPLCAAFVAAKLAELRHQPIRDILATTTRNAKTLFGV